VALPDYPSLKHDISNYLLLFLRAARVQRMGPFNKSAHVTYHEGDTSDFSTVDGEIKELDTQAVGVDEEITLSALAYLTNAQAIEAMQKYGIQIADQMTRRFLRNLNETIEAIGNVTEGGGRALDAEVLLDTYRMIEMSFDDDGRVNMPDLISGNPAASETVARIHEDEQFITELNALIDQKREEWLARESNRKLVD